MKEEKETVAEETAAEEKKGIKARDASLAGKISALVLLIGGTITLVVLRIAGIIKDNDTLEALSGVIVGAAFSILGVFGTVDFNLALDKLTGRKG